MNVITDVNAHSDLFKKEGLTQAEVRERIQANEPAPSSVLYEKWTKEVLKCPACEQQSFDKFTGGPSIRDSEITETDAIYHCRVCGLNLTQEEYELAIAG